MNAAEWDVVATLLGPSVRCIALDLPGHGRTGRLERWSWTEIDTMLEDVRAQLGGERLVLVGHSLGGVAAIHYAARHDCALVVNVDGWIGSPLRPVPHEQREAARARRFRMLNELSVDRRRYLRLQRHNADRQGLSWDVVGPMLERQLQPPDGQLVTFRPCGDELRAVADAIDEYARSTFAHDAVHLRCRMLVVAAVSSEEDEISMVLSGRVATSDAWDAITDMLATAREPVEVHRLASGHNVPLEKPAELAAVLRSAFDRLGSDGA